MQTIVLRMDYRSSAKIEELQKQANAGDLTKNTALPPHLTLQSFTQSNPADLEKAIQTVASSSQQFKISFSSIGFFKQQGTFFLSPVKNERLNAIHKAILLATQEFRDSDALYQADYWVPHATIANSVQAQFWGPLFSRFSMEFEPFEAKVTAIECWSIVNGKTENEWSIFLN